MLRLAVQLLAVFCLLTPLFAQVDTGVISGTIIDKSGARLPRVSVAITSAGTGFATSVSTNSEGIYVSPPLKPGRYEISAELAGFQRTLTEIVLEINQRAVVDLELAVGQVSEQVTVVAEAPLLERESSSLGNIRTEKAIKELFAGSKYIIDYERNLVVAKGTPEQLLVMERIIEEFDRPIQQVLIEARFVTISKPAFLQLGALWETGRQAQAARVPQDFTGLVSTENIANLGIGVQETFTNILNRETLSLTISALEQSGESQTLSSPRLTVLNNRPATISDGKVQYYYEEYQVKQIAQQYYTASSFVPSGKPPERGLSAR